MRGILFAADRYALLVLIPHISALTEHGPFLGVAAAQRYQIQTTVSSKENSAHVERMVKCGPILDNVIMEKRVVNDIMSEEITPFSFNIMDDTND